MLIIIKVVVAPYWNVNTSDKEKDIYYDFVVVAPYWNVNTEEASYISSLVV